MTETQDDARLRAVDFQGGVDLVVRLLEHHALRVLNPLRFDMSAGAIVEVLE